MKKENTIYFRLNADSEPSDDTDWEYLRNMTAEEAHQNALDDPDAQPMTEEELREMGRVPDVAAIREKAKLSQEEFAARFGLSLFLLRDWEAGRAPIDKAARTLLLIIESDPGAVERALRKAS